MYVLKGILYFSQSISIKSFFSISKVCPLFIVCVLVCFVSIQYVGTFPTAPVYDITLCFICCLFHVTAARMISDNTGVSVMSWPWTSDFSVVNMSDKVPNLPQTVAAVCFTFSK